MITLKQLLEGKSHELLTVAPTDHVSRVLQILADKKVGAVLVMDGDQMVGIVSERDCAIKVALPGKRADETFANEIMTRAVISVEPKQTLEECIRLMNERDIRHLPVMEGGRVIGIVSIGDVSKEMLKQLFQLVGQLESYIRGSYSV